jgi:HAD superfamily hydrolase (TIGR01458 family)
MADLSRVEGLLIDIDGVLTVSGVPIAGSPEAVARLRAAGVPFRLMTNTTEMTRRELVRQLAGAGFGVATEEIVTAVLMTADYLKSEHPGARCFLLGGPDSTEDLEGIELARDHADVVVIGGSSRSFDWDDMNHALRLALDGAPLVGMHRTVAWMVTDGLALDTGVMLLNAIEAATGREAVVCGKPAQQAFKAGLHELGLPAERVAMVGDDVNTDALAAQSCGVAGVLVRTGKFREDVLERATGTPDAVIDSLADLPGLLRTRTSR